MRSLASGSRRTRLVSLFGCAGLALAMGAVSWDAYTAPTSVEAVAAPRAALAAPEYFAQTYSPYCQTSQGLCTMPSSLPVGDPCTCGGAQGRVVP